MDIKRKVKRYLRGISFVLRSFFWEKPRGIDFSMRQKSAGIKAKGNHGYALTQRKSFANIIKRLDICADDKFIDIGCGKGGVLYYATSYPFKRVAGVEIEDNLYEIAVNNFKRLKISKVELFHADATTFDQYNGFNVFFLFNPFDADIYEKVVENIFSTLTDERKDSRVLLICYGQSITEYIKERNVMELIDSYTDDVRCTAVNIWRWEK